MGVVHTCRPERRPYVKLVLCKRQPSLALWSIVIRRLRTVSISACVAAVLAPGRSRSGSHPAEVQSLDSLFHITQCMPEAIREAPQGIMCVLLLLETAMGFQQYDEGLQRKCLLLLLAAMKKCRSYVDDVGEAGVPLRAIHATAPNCCMDSSSSL